MHPESQKGGWSTMTQVAFDALPSRLDHKDYVVGQVYRDPENPLTVFAYEGQDDHREGWLHGRPGVARNDRWVARGVTIVL